jgi:hypothetical protein
VRCSRVQGPPSLRVRRLLPALGRRRSPRRGSRTEPLLVAGAPERSDDEAGKHVGTRQYGCVSRPVRPVGWRKARGKRPPQHKESGRWEPDRGWSKSGPKRGKKTARCPAEVPGSGGFPDGAADQNQPMTCRLRVKRGLPAGIHGRHPVLLSGANGGHPPHARPRSSRPVVRSRVSTLP